MDHCENTKLFLPDWNKFHYHLSMIFFKYVLQIEICSKNNFFMYFFTLFLCSKCFFYWLRWFFYKIFIKNPILPGLPFGSWASKNSDFHHIKGIWLCNIKKIFQIHLQIFSFPQGFWEFWFIFFILLKLLSFLKMSFSFIKYLFFHFNRNVNFTLNLWRCHLSQFNALNI